MLRTVEPPPVSNRFFLTGSSDHDSEDRILQVLAVIALYLEIIVFIEPAPVDVAIMACFVFGVLFRKLEFREISTPALVSAAVFVAANLISMYNPLDPGRALWYVLVTVYLVVSWFFFVGLFGRYDKPMVAASINAYCVAGLISAALGIGGYFHLLPFSDTLLKAGRAKGLFKDCNVYGPYFVPMALLALTRLLHSRSTWRAKFVPLLFFFSAAFAMFLCFSRACWLNFALALAVFLGLQVAFGRSKKLVRQHIGAMLIVLIGAGASIYLLSDIPAVRDMLELRVTSNGLQDYDRIRFATQGLALETAESHPLGIGPGQAEEEFGYATHSMYLRILSENGAAALLAILAFIGVTMVRSWTVIRRTKNEWLREINFVVFACIVGHLANSAVIDTVHWRHIWFIYALPWAPMYDGEIPRRLRSGASLLVRRASVVAHLGPRG